jgi:hypothetical protein
MKTRDLQTKHFFLISGGIVRKVAHSLGSAIAEYLTGNEGLQAKITKVFLCDVLP